MADRELRELVKYWREVAQYVATGAENEDQISDENKIYVRCADALEAALSRPSEDGGREVACINCKQAVIVTAVNGVRCEQCHAYLDSDDQQGGKEVPVSSEPLDRATLERLRRHQQGGTK